MEKDEKKCYSLHLFPLQSHFPICKMGVIIPRAIEPYVNDQEYYLWVKQLN